jgi:hypothetical protein
MTFIIRMLIDAIKHKNVDRVKDIVLKNKIKDFILPNGLSILWRIDIANYNKEDSQILQILIENNVDIDSKNYYEQTMLHRCIEIENTKLFEDLLALGANLDAIDHSGQTPLHYAIYNCNLYMVYSLLELGADPYIPDNKGWTPFMNLALQLFPQKEIYADVISSIEDILIDVYTKTELKKVTNICKEYGNDKLYNKICNKNFKSIN